MVARACREPDSGVGPAILRTPNGLGTKEWELGLQAYAKQYTATMQAKQE